LTRIAFDPGRPNGIGGSGPQPRLRAWATCSGAHPGGCPADRAGDRVTFAADPARPYFFDPDTGPYLVTSDGQIRSLAGTLPRASGSRMVRGCGNLTVTQRVKGPNRSLT
jgi:hypothetical protein